jgi:hypothetical protein
MERMKLIGGYCETKVVGGKNYYSFLILNLNTGLLINYKQNNYIEINIFNLKI